MLKFLIINFLILTGLVLQLTAQDSYESRLLRGTLLFQKGDLNAAARVLEKCYQDSSTDLRVLQLLSEVETKRQRHHTALDWLKKADDISPDDILVRYLKGICRREIGKYKAFLLQRREYKKSENNFKYVIENEPDFRDVFYQYAILENYQDNYASAVSYAEIQRNRSPGNLDVAIGTHRFYDSFLHNRKLDDYLQWFESHRNSRAHIYLGEAFRLDRQYNKADSVFQLVFQEHDSTMSLVPLRLAASKLSYQMGNERKAQRLFEQAIDSIKTTLDAALMFRNVLYIMEDSELQEYRSLKTPEEKRDFFNKMFVIRDPMPASPDNYRIIEHIRRVIYAEENYYYDGFRTEFSNPDKLHFLVFPKVFDLNERFNDKGLVYIRHGQPDDVAFDVKENAPQNVSWLYYPGTAAQEKLMFHFLQGETQTGNNWRLVATLPRYLLESRMQWDPVFYQIMTGTAIEAISLEHEMAMKSRKSVREGLNSDRHTWQKDIQTLMFPFYVSSFRGDSDKTLCEVYYSFRKDELLGKKGDISASDTLSVGFAVFDNDMNKRHKQHRKIPIQQIVRATDSLGFWPDVFAFQEFPGQYRLSLSAQLTSVQAVGGYRFKFNAASYQGSLPMMSGLELAESIRVSQGTVRFDKNELTVMPMPEKVFNRKEPIHIYFELYNLAVTDRRLDFMVDYKVRLLESTQNSIFDRISSLFRKRQPMISNKVERFSNEPTSIEYTALDLSENDPGLYELEVVTVIPAHQDTLSRQIKFELK